MQQFVRKLAALVTAAVAEAAVLDIPFAACRAGTRTMKITGDYHHTAIAVARDLGMVKPQGQIVVIDTIGLSELRSELSAMNSPYTAAPKATPPMSAASDTAQLLPWEGDQQADHRADPEDAVCLHQDRLDDQRREAELQTSSGLIQKCLPPRVRLSREVVSLSKTEM